MRAQGVYYAPRPLYVYEPEPMIPPRAVAYRLMDHGFSDVGRPRFDGRAYVVDATNPAGDRVRLYVDARNGAVVGRERLGDPYFPSARAGRPAPGYGWTEEDRPRGFREVERLVPPADIPDAAPSGVRSVRPQARAELEPPPPSRPGAPEGNLLGVNPDAPARHASRPVPVKPGQARPEQARPGQGKPEQAKIVPTQPAPGLPPAGEAARSEPAVAAVESPKASEPRVQGPRAGEQAAAPTTPASIQPPAEKAAEAAAPKGGWKDPPAGEAKKNVRVISGATVVPGAGDASGANPN